MAPQAELVRPLGHVMAVIPPVVCTSNQVSRREPEHCPLRLQNCLAAYCPAQLNCSYHVVRRASRLFSSYAAAFSCQNQDGAVRRRQMRGAEPTCEGHSEDT